MPERHLNVRLFPRTTRSLRPTEYGEAFYEGACAVIAAVEAAEGRVAAITGSPRGPLHVAAPLGIGRRMLAPAVPAFLDACPDVSLRLRLSYRAVELTAEGLDMAFILGTPEDSTLTIRKVCDCRRVTAAAPSYVAARGMPRGGDDLVTGGLDCLILRYPGVSEFRWRLTSPEGPRRYPITGRLHSDDGEVLTDWALDGRSVALKPHFEVADHPAEGALVAVAEDTPPEPVQIACLCTHRRPSDPKRRLFMDWAIPRIRKAVRAAEARLTASAAEVPRQVARANGQSRSGT